MLERLQARAHVVWCWLWTIPVAQFVTLSSAAAQTEGESAGESRSAAFQAVEGAVQEDIAGGPLLLATYAVIWLVLFAYVLRVVRLQKRTQGELEGLRAALAQAEPPLKERAE